MLWDLSAYKENNFDSKPKASLGPPWKKNSVLTDGGTEWL